MEVMLDFEALRGFHPDPAVLARGRITSIGAVRFDARAPVFQVVGSMCALVELEDVDAGEIDGATLAWWLQQTEAAQAWGLPHKARSKGHSLCLRDALFLFHSWLKPADRIWCHYYDKVLLLGAWARSQGTRPPSFEPHKIRDFGAVEKVAELAGIELPDRHANKAHTPVEDATDQARCLHAFVQKCKGVSL